MAVACVLAVGLGLARFMQWEYEISAVQGEQDAVARRYGFNPGNIISDGQFFNGNAMSRAEIQSFLNVHGASCSGGRCLKSKTFDTVDRPADNLCDAYTGANGESAAAIIDKAARACDISQKVLLTMVQKEQHLVTAAAPTDFQYKAAMGLSCPDSADCDPAYAGFFNQVYGAARRYQYYRAHAKNYRYHAGTLNYVAYHPDKACGGSTVYIENEATALLYVYTPYQPNSAALRANTGDSCSSYGNRNFSLIYRNWFGDPGR
jgi:hypothetical protein